MHSQGIQVRSIARHQYIQSRGIKYGPRNFRMFCVFVYSFNGAHLGSPVLHLGRGDNLYPRYLSGNITDPRETNTSTTNSRQTNTRHDKPQTDIHQTLDPFIHGPRNRQNMKLSLNPFVHSGIHGGYFNIRLWMSITAKQIEKSKFGKKYFT